MYVQRVEIGDKLEINEISSKNKSLKYKSQVENIFDKDKLTIYTPIYQGDIVRLRRGEVYPLLFHNDEGLIRFEGKIISNKNEGGFYMTDIQLIDEGMQIQRREFYRFSCLIDSIFAFRNPERNNNSREIRFKGIIKDISGGGVRFISNYKINEKSNIEIFIVIDDEQLVIDGRVLNRQLEFSSNYKYQYRIKFLNIEEKNKEKIIHFIFAQQRKLLKKLI